MILKSFKKLYLEAMLTFLVAILSLLTIFGSFLSYKEGSCQNEINNTHTSNFDLYFRTQTMDDLFNKHINEKVINDDLLVSVLAATNDLHREIESTRKIIENKILDCKKFNIWIGISFPLQIILSIIIFVISIFIIKKTKK
ncbi:MAG: hypothetical protein Q8P32_02660 [Candidatus Komeilibacteria bacterium]|nr:hypothetical protein [Candidatus Komeilibacteria bacterium]